MRIVPRRLERIEIKPAERVIADDKNPATVLDQSLCRLNQLLIKTPPWSIRLGKQILRGKNHLRVRLHQRKNRLASRNLVKLLPRRSNRPKPYPPTAPQSTSHSCPATIAPSAPAKDEGHPQATPPDSRPRHSTPHQSCAHGSNAPYNLHRDHFRSQEKAVSSRR